MFSMTKVMTSLPTSLLIFLAIELMDMDRNREAFRKRFLSYKNGKPIKDIYDAGLPKYEDGREVAREQVELNTASSDLFGRRKLSPLQFYYNYRNSAGFRERFDRGTGRSGSFYEMGMDNFKVPYVRRTEGGGSSYIPNQNVVNLDTTFNSKPIGMVNSKFALAHELSHQLYNTNTLDTPEFKYGNTPLGKYTTPNGENKTTYQIWVKNNSGLNVDFSHDKSITEGGADIGALRYLLYNEGVFNSMDPNAKINKDQLLNFYNSYKAKNPDAPYIRPLENYGIDDAVYLLNNTASIDNKKDNGLFKAANGKLPKYDDGKTVNGGWLPEITVTGEKRRHSAIDYLLWKADRAGAPSHVTNAVRDFNNRIQNFPVIAADATARYIKGGYDNILQAYKAADVNPSKSLKKFLVYPYTNDENNYSKEELAAMRKLSDITGKGTGAIGYKAYRQVNNGRYAGDIDFKDFNKPNKVIEWSLGQTERRTGNEPYLYDSFSYDTKDTKGVYLNGALHGNVNPIMALRSIFGIIGSKGYDDGTNSATSIKTRIPTRYLRK